MKAKDTKRLIDYSKMVTGTLVNEHRGESVERCPRCGQNGRKETRWQPRGRAKFEHRIWERIEQSPFGVFRILFDPETCIADDVDQAAE